MELHHAPPFPWGSPSDRPRCLARAIATSSMRRITSNNWCASSDEGIENERSSPQTGQRAVKVLIGVRDRSHTNSGTASRQVVPCRTKNSMRCSACSFTSITRRRPRTPRQRWRFALSNCRTSRDRAPCFQRACPARDAACAFSSLRRTSAAFETSQSRGPSRVASSRIPHLTGCRVAENRTR
jgi:hypothetical protein